MATCLNCTRESLPDDDLCRICLDRVEAMVDNTQLEGTSQVDMRTNVNPFFSSNQTTGRLAEQEGTVSGSVERDEDDTSFFWAVVLGIIIVLFGMISFFLN